MVRIDDPVRITHLTTDGSAMGDLR